MEVNIIMAQRFILNGTSYHGKGAIKEIATEAISRGFKKAFVCSDPDLVKFNVTSKVTDLLEYQHKKEQKEKRIARQDELVREVKKSHKISGEEIVRKEIPGLERTSMTWMRDMIYGRGA